MTDAQIERAMQSLAEKINGLVLEDSEKMLLSQILTAAVDAATVSAAAEVLLRSRAGAAGSPTQPAQAAAADQPAQAAEAAQPETKESQPAHTASSSESILFPSLGEQFIGLFTPGLIEQISRIGIKVRVGTGIEGPGRHDEQ